MMARNKQTKPLNAKLEKIGISIGNAIVSMQRNCAGWLDKNFNGLSTRTKKSVLISFGLLFFLASVLSALRPFFFPVIKKTVHPTVYEKSSIGRANERDALLDTLFKNRVLKYERFRDSLSKTSAGQKRIRLLDLAHPGLADSIAQLKHHYHMNK